MICDIDTMNPREAIRELTYHYSFYCDTMQFDKVADLFAEDAVFDETVLGFPLATGKKEIAAFFGGDTVETLAYNAHYITNHFLTELTETEAKGTCHLLFEGALRDGTPLKISGYLEDGYVRVGGRWLFKSRKLTPFAKPEGVDRVDALRESSAA